MTKNISVPKYKINLLFLHLSEDLRRIWLDFGNPTPLIITGSYNILKVKIVIVLNIDLFGSITFL